MLGSVASFSLAPSQPQSPQSGRGSPYGSALVTACDSPARGQGRMVAGERPGTAGPRGSPAAPSGWRCSKKDESVIYRQGLITSEPETTSH